MGKLSALEELAKALRQAISYSGYRGNNLKLAEIGLSRSAQSFIPAVDPRKIADTFNMAYDELRSAGVPKKLMAALRSGNKTVTESDISRALDEGSNAFGLRITPTDDIRRYVDAPTIGAHYAPVDRPLQVRPFVRRYKNEGFETPQITAVHHQINAPLVADDAALEDANILASRFGRSFNDLFRQQAGDLSHIEKSNLMTRLLDDAGVDSIVYENLLEGRGRNTNFLEMPYPMNWATLVSEPGTLRILQEDPRLAKKLQSSTAGFLNPSVAAIKPLSKLKKGGLIQMKECSTQK